MNEESRKRMDEDRAMFQESIKLINEVKDMVAPSKEETKKGGFLARLFGRE